MTTLFSPVGTADPITQLGDGPMLHLVRYEKPNKVVLFMTPAMSEFQRIDGRYTRAINLLAESINIPMPEIEVIESDFNEVYRFDRYIEVFEPILKELSEDDDVLVNVSSGTAGMTQALVALGSFGRLDLGLRQVLTPRRDINARHDRENPNEYDFDFLWELDSEIESEGECRIIPVATPNFGNRLLKESVRTLIRDYEYESAYNLACLKGGLSSPIAEMIEAASARLNLDGNLPAKVFGGTDLCYKANDLLLEYLYVMEVRLAQGHWADFVRSMTPALTELMRRKLSLDLPGKKYELFKKGEPTGKYNVSAINKDHRLEKVLSKYHYENKSSFISNEAYAALIQEYCDDERTISLITKLRNAEKKCRNKLAHTLKASSKTALEGLCDMSLEEIMSDLFELHGSAAPGLYDRINQRIVDSM